MSDAALNESDIQNVRKLIISWQGHKITWAALVSMIKRDLGITISRQSLCKYGAINTEYQRKKEMLRGVVSTDPNITVADANTITSLQKKLETATSERDMYKRDYEKAQLLLNRVIVNANTIPNLDIKTLFLPTE